MHTFLWLIFAFTSFSQGADKVLTCKSIKETSISKGIGAEAKFEATATQTPKDSSVTFVTQAKTALIKGNGGQTTAARIGPDSFIEITTSGNRFLWTLLSSADGSKYLVSMKAYTLVEPSTFTVLWKCD